MLKRELVLQAIAELGQNHSNSGPPLRLIHPLHAIEWVAFGAFEKEREDPVKVWWMAASLSDEYEAYANAGRQELAEELILNSITSGQLRCAFIQDMNGKRSLLVADPEQFSNADVQRSDDEIFGLDIYWCISDQAEIEDDYLSIGEFFLIWEELQKLRLDTRDTENTILARSALPGLEHHAPVSPRSPSHARQPSLKRRGRRPRPYGAPIARFLARVEAMGTDQAAREKDSTLGSWLLEEYEALRIIPAPDPRNASADARGALNAWRDARCAVEKAQKT